jgi:ATP-dependent Clp protease ATP-binding subunit ClpA
MVVDKFVMQLEVQLSEKGVSVLLTDKARDWLATKGYDKNFGARPLARVIQEHIKKPLAEELLFGRLVDGGTVTVDLLKEKLVLKTEAANNKDGKLKKVVSKGNDKKKDTPEFT